LLLTINSQVSAREDALKSLLCLWVVLQHNMNIFYLFVSRDFYNRAHNEHIVNNYIKDINIRT